MNLVYSKKLIEILTTGKESVKYTLNFFDGKYILTPPKSSEYYKPVIVISNIEDLETKLKEYFDALKSLYDLNSDTKYYMDYYYRVLINNLTNSDSLELEKFVDLRTSFLNDNTFDLLEKETIVTTSEINGTTVTYSCIKCLEEPGLETPFIIEFYMTINDKKYELPIVRYGIKDNECHIYTIQYGKNRVCTKDDERFKRVVNKFNSGIKENRGVSPSFVLSFILFLKLLQESNIKKIVIPDFIYARYKHYYKNSSEEKSDKMLERIFNKFHILLKRMEEQVIGIEVDAYCNEFDSKTHWTLKRLKSNNIETEKILNPKNDN